MEPVYSLGTRFRRSAPNQVSESERRRLVYFDVVSGVVIARLVQSFLKVVGAYGGECIGASTSPPRLRGLWNSRERDSVA